MRVAAPDPIAYMDAAARSTAGRDYKRRVTELLDVRPGQVVVDLGCGPGTDLVALADRAGPHGRVIGVDRDGRMLAEARRRLDQPPAVDLHQRPAGNLDQRRAAGNLDQRRPGVNLQAADLHGLPLVAGSVDRARTDRVLQHVDNPGEVLAEARRVLRPGGLLVTAEPDWDTVAVADEDLESSRRFARFLAGQVRHPTIGRQLPWLAARAGFAVDAVEAVPVLFRDFETADRILGLRRHGARAMAGGTARAWLNRLAAGPFVAGFTLYLARLSPADATGLEGQPDPPAETAGGRFPGTARAYREVRG